jgi:NADH dehydrogenase FAD-containing subunit
MYYILLLAANSSWQLVNFILNLLTLNYFLHPISPKAMSEKSKHILILGGSYAGVSTAHRLLKQPSNNGDAFKITLVSPNTHFYWNMAAPRGILPDQIPDEYLFQSIATGFSQYPKERFEFIVAAAESLDAEHKKVVITDGRVLEYDFLIIATGTRMVGGMPLKSLGSTEETRNKLHDYQKRIVAAKTIVVAGAGVTGVEVAGELGEQFGKVKNITLVTISSFAMFDYTVDNVSDCHCLQLSSTPTILASVPKHIIQIANDTLQTQNVTIKHSIKVLSTTLLPNNQQELALSNGEKLLTDLYIPTFGLLPNSSYIPQKLLNKDGYVMVDEYLNSKSDKSIWAIGDVSNVELSQFKPCDRQSAHLAKNLGLILNHRSPVAYKAYSSRKSYSPRLRNREHILAKGKRGDIR